MDNFLSELEQQVLKQKSIMDRKQKGQFFTPSFISEILGLWLTTTSSPITNVLDPAIGYGSLVSPLPHVLPVDGYDIDEELLQFAEDALSDHSSLNLIHKDYLTSDWNKQYDGIVCNPPYIRFREFKDKQKYLNLFQDKLGLKLSGATNLYAFFLIKALHQLSEKGRAAFIIPSDFLHADYGEIIKEYMLKKANLHLVVIADFHLNWFDDAVTTSALFFFDNAKQVEETEFVHLTNQTELPILKQHLINYYENKPIGTSIPSIQIKPNKKWRMYYQTQGNTIYKNTKPLSTFAKVSRGIATGANHFFCLTEADLETWHIDQKYVSPCVTKSHQLAKHFFTQDDFEELVQMNAPIYLLDIKKEDADDPHVHTYIQHGEQQGYHERFLTKKRRPWYKNEKRNPADILVNVFSRGKVKFIRNEANVRNLTAFHCIFVHPQYRDDLEVLMAFFMTDICQSLLEQYHREYGKGLKKFEPNDLNQSEVVDLDMIPSDIKNAIRELYQQIRIKHIHQTEKDHTKAVVELNLIFTDLLMRG
ncbi:SAM-dependent methyltransferase [Aquibacillus koreensis]|uniref:site-specific DNA-methyltransferase (adenine-specific) n=1 Tax=Aquibacillus koreensis TaxID=279446 RepID=A0A9X3WP13_9BACI|nr:SAM-dependent methyltransferase [Aquibacillus koreensis]MCT2538232.1 SAM-dependent methyltransferase [Aquibacillus koreensis]MDC3420824.1 SAM-dependent methyltransferase [Aquibacillus koreensis]